MNRQEQEKVEEQLRQLEDYLHTVVETLEYAQELETAAKRVVETEQDPYTRDEFLREAIDGLRDVLAKGRVK